MIYDEARLKHQSLAAEAHKIQHRTEWAELEGLERLLRQVRVVRARLGLRPVPNE